MDYNNTKKLKEIFKGYNGPEDPKNYNPKFAILAQDLGNPPDMGEWDEDIRDREQVNPMTEEEFHEDSD